MLINFDECALLFNQERGLSEDIKYAISHPESDEAEALTKLMREIEVNIKSLYTMRFRVDQMIAGAKADLELERELEEKKEE